MGASDSTLVVAVYRYPPLDVTQTALNADTHTPKVGDGVLSTEEILYIPQRNILLGTCMQDSRRASFEVQCLI